MESGYKVTFPCLTKLRKNIKLPVKRSAFQNLFARLSTFKTLNLEFLPIMFISVFNTVRINHDNHPDESKTRTQQIQ